MAHNDTIKVYKIYCEQEDDNVRKKQAVCDHPMWIKKCSCCSAILDNEKLHDPTEKKEVYLD